MTLNKTIVRWRDARRELPDSDETVLAHFPDSSEPVWLGFHNGLRWLTVEGLPARVSHWAEMPEAPTC